LSQKHSKREGAIKKETRQAQPMLLEQLAELLAYCSREGECLSRSADDSSQNSPALAQAAPF
jgi:hypothetical protein